MRVALYCLIFALSGGLSSALAFYTAPPATKVLAVATALTVSFVATLGTSGIVDRWAQKLERHKRKIKALLLIVAVGIPFQVTAAAGLFFAMRYLGVFDISTKALAPPVVVPLPPSSAEPPRPDAATPLPTRTVSAFPTSQDQSSSCYRMIADPKVKLVAVPPAPLPVPRPVKRKAPKLRAREQPTVRFSLSVAH